MSLLEPYANILDTPLKLDEEQAVARTALCGIFGVHGTYKMRPNIKEIEMAA